MTPSQAGRAQHNHYTVVPLNERLAEQLCGWQYEPPYNFYNWTSWDAMKQEEREFGDPAIRERQYAAVLDDSKTFVGFAQFFPLLGVLRIGLGLRPDLCGQQQGLPFVKAVVEEAKRRAPQDEIDLEVHVWNHRAIRVYEKVGFVIADTYEIAVKHKMELVHCMVYAAGQQ